MPIMLNEQDTVACGNTQDCQHSYQGTERNDAVARKGCEYTADQRRRKSEINESRQPPVLKGHVEHDENHEHKGDRSVEEISLRGLTLLVFSQQVRVVPDRELDGLEPVLDLLGHR